MGRGERGERGERGARQPTAARVHVPPRASINCLQDADDGRMLIVVTRSGLRYPTPASSAGQTIKGTDWQQSAPIVTAAVSAATDGV